VFMITQEQVKSIFTYKDSTGELINRFSRGRKAKKGCRAGTDSATGYLQMSIFGKGYTTHRIVFLYHHGYLPKYVDHINGIKSDNRIENLRSCTKTQNGQNSKIWKNNKSGIKGVCWDRWKKAWVAYVSVNGKSLNLGRFWDKEVAGQVVRIERIKHHGEFCNHG